MTSAMLGFGPRLNTVFKSRWKAVIWSGCVLLTAWCTVPAANHVRAHETAKAQDKAPQASPWAY